MDFNLEFLKKVFLDAFQIFTKNWLPLVLILLISFLITLVPQFLAAKALSSAFPIFNKIGAVTEQYTDPGLIDSATEIMELADTPMNSLTAEELKVKAEDTATDLVGQLANAPDKVMELSKKFEAGEEITLSDAASVIASEVSFMSILWAIIFSIIALILSMVTQMIITKASLDAVMERKITLSSILATSKKLIPLTLLSLAFFILSLVTIIPILGLLVFLAIILTFVFTPFLIFEKNMGVIDAAKESMQMTSKHYIHLILIFIAIMVLNFFGTLLLGVGLLATIPYGILVVAQLYKALDSETPSPFEPAPAE